MTLARVCLILLLFTASLTLFSCSALEYFNSGTGEEAPAAQEQTAPADQETAVSAESEQAGDSGQMDALQNKISVLENKVDSLESQVAGQKKVVYTVEYSDPAQLYQKARGLLLSNDIDNAADLFSTFAKAHPDHSLADNALYWLGECHYTKGRYDQSILVFKDLVAKYPKAEKVPDALLKTGYAYLSQDDVNRASHFLKKVIKKYPFSPAAEKAQEKLRTFE